MNFKEELICVGNLEKGYALFNKTTGEFMSDFIYSNIVNTNYGLHFLYKGESQDDYTIVDNTGKEVEFDKKYFWGALGRSPFGVGCVVGVEDNKYYLANCKGQVLSSGYDRRLLSHSAYSRIFETTNVLENSGRRLKGLLSIDGVELVPCQDEYIPEFDDVFVLTELVEKYGYGLIQYASDEILASDMIFIRLLEAAIKSIKTLPDFVDKAGFIIGFAQDGVFDMSYLRLELCFDRGIARNKTELDAKETFAKFEALVEGLFNDGYIANRLTADFLKKKVNVVLEKIVGTPNNVYMFD